MNNIRLFEANIQIYGSQRRERLYKNSGEIATLVCRFRNFFGSLGRTI